MFETTAQSHIAIVRARSGCWDFAFAVIYLLCIGLGQAFAQTNLYFNNTIPGARNWGGSNGGNGFWATAPSGGTFRTVTTINDIANFSTDVSLAGATDIFTGAGQAAYGLNFGVGPNAMGPFRLRASFNVANDRTFQLGAGGITVAPTVQGVSFSNRDIVNNVATGEMNMVLMANQTWTNHSTHAIDFGGRIVGRNGIHLTKAGSGPLILRADNRTVNINGTIGFSGKVFVEAGTLVLAHPDALGIKTPENAGSSTGLPDPRFPMSSDTIISSGATLDVNDQSIRREFITVSGSGVGGTGAIVNNAVGPGNGSGFLSDVQLAGNTTVGGATARWEIRTSDSKNARLYQDGYTLTKTGGNTVGLIDTTVVGGGDIHVQQGTLELGGFTTFDGNGTLSVANGANLTFARLAAGVSKPIVLSGNNLVTSTEIGTSTTLASNISLNGPVTFAVPDTDGNSSTKSLNLTGSTIGNGDLVKTGAGRLAVKFDGASYSGSEIDVQGGSLRLTTIGQVASNIRLGDSSPSPEIGTVGISGEGKTTGRLSFGEGNELTLIAETNGPDQYLRVGSLEHRSATPVKILPTALLNGQSNIVVLESANQDANANNFVLRNDVRGELRTAGSQLLLDHHIADLTWRGNDPSRPEAWDIASTSNWLNAASSSSDRFYSPDRVLFDDTVAGGSTTINLAENVITSAVRFNNSTTNYTLTTTNTGRIDASTGTLVKQGTGTTVLNSIAGGATHRFSETNVEGGVLELSSVGSGNAGVSRLGSTTVHRDAILRDRVETANGKFDGSVNVAAGGTFEMIRSAVPGLVGTSPGVVTLYGGFSGAGDVILRATASPTMMDSFGDYAFAYPGGNPNANFTGRWILDHARLDTNGSYTGNHSTIVVPQGSQVHISGSTPNTNFEIAGTGWTHEPANSQTGGALRISGDITASSSIMLTGDSRITGSSYRSGTIGASISGTGSVEYGSPGTNTQNGIALTGNNSYSGHTTIHNHLISAENNRAFSDGNIYLRGNLSGGTALAVGTGTTIHNDIFVGSTAGVNLGGGAIRGGTIRVGGGGVGVIAGNITFEGSMAPNRAHFGNDQSYGRGENLEVTGAINIANPTSQPISFDDNNDVGSRGYTEFSGGGNYTKFDLRAGEIRLGAHNGLASGVELMTRSRDLTINGRYGFGTFDMNGFDQTVSHITRAGSFNNDFTLTNSGARESTLTILGNGDSEIQHMPLATGGSAINIIKNGPGKLTFNGYGYTGDFNNPGRYTINGGDFSFVNPTSGSITLNAGRITGGGVILGESLITGGGLSPGDGPGGRVRFANGLEIRGDTFYDWELGSINASQSFDSVVVGGTLDMRLLDRMTIRLQGMVEGVPGMININAFDPLRYYSWAIFQASSPILGLEESDFFVDTTAFAMHNPFNGSFSIEAVNGFNVVNLKYSPIPSIPEPSTWMLVACGLAYLAGKRRIGHK